MIPRRSLAFVFLALALLAGGCATAPPHANARPFDFQHDTFAYANELVWDYHFDEHGKWVSQPRRPKPDYTLHCFVVARSARQFFDQARFDANQPVVDADTYRRLVNRVVSRNPRQPVPENARIVIPGYADLRSFSQAQETLLKAECGGAWQSYFQRGHWRMIFPFSRTEQERMARQLCAEISRNEAPVVHLVRFPQLKINHAVLLFAAHETESTITFAAYDPNYPEKPATLSYDRARHTFALPANDYFSGGRVDVYEVFHDWCD